MTYEPTLTATDSPSPRVRVTFPTLHASTQTVTVYRSYDNEVTLVRDAINAFAAGGFTVTDYEVPLGVAVWYAAEMFDVNGVSLGVTGNADTVVYGSKGYVWVSNPLDSTQVVLLRLSERFLSGGYSRRVPMRRYQIADNTVVLYGQRGLASGVRLDCLTQTAEDTETLDAILSGISLWRTTPDVELPRLFYTVVPSPQRVALNHHVGGELTGWEIDADQVTAPTGSAGVYEGTWQDVIDTFASWNSSNSVMGAYPTWLDLLENPPGV